jgi:penicillin G amidase
MDFDHGYRANEITQRIQAATSGGAKIDADGMRAIQGDTNNEFASVLVPYLKGASVAPGAAKAKALLDGWDFTTPPDSAAAAYFYEVWKYLLQDAIVTKLPSDVSVDGGDRWYAAVTGLLTDPTSFWWTDTSSTSGAGNRDALLGEAMNQASEALAKQQGGDPAKWQWGRMHALTPTNQTLGTAGPWFVKDLLNGDPLPVGGGAAIVDANSFDISKGFAVDESPSMRMVVDLGNLDQSTWVNLTGASGHVTSDNYLDQAPLWRDLKTLPWPYSRGAVTAATKNTLVLLPT